jgi:hypothetical protein
MLKIHVRKAGLFSAAGHEHWVTASFATGSLNGGNSLEVSFTGEYYSGCSRIKQTDFGINPVSLAGGLVRVKNELEVQFVVVPIQNREISENVVRACFSHDCVMRHEE